MNWHGKSAADVPEVHHLDINVTPVRVSALTRNMHRAAITILQEVPTADAWDN